MIGEYTVLQGSPALALPFSKFYGQFIKTDQVDSRLLEFSEYLMDLSSIDGLLDNDKLRLIAEEFRFESNIPLGAGLGSSGALTAGIFDQCVQSKNGLDLKQLKQVLGEIESFFHGNSSGTDPLVSYLNQSIIINNGEIEMSDFNVNQLIHACYIMDSGLSRNTQEHVDLYHQLMANDATFKQAMEKLSALNTILVESICLNDEPRFWHHINELSVIQYEAMQAFIPPSIKKIWKSGLENKTHFIKLCGAGGGGFFLAFAERQQNLHKEMFVPIY